MTEDEIAFVRVINGNAKTVTGRFNGKDYVFKPDVPLDIPEVVAVHIFGFGLADKSVALARLGWARSSDEMEAGMERLEKMTFEEPPELVEVPRPKGKRKGVLKADDETGTAGPPVNASGTEGGGFKPPPTGPKIGQAEADGTF